ERGSRILGKQMQTYAWYRFLHRYSFWRGVRSAIPNREIWRRLIYSTPILMYQAFQARGKSSSRFTVSSRRFALQMAWLKWMGYSVISLEEYLRYRQEFRLPPAGSVVITMDDDDDNLTVAYPILRHYQYPATVFLVSDCMNGANHWHQRSELSGRP